MASFKVRKFKDPETLERFLQGGVQGGAPLVGGVSGLVGKTLKFSSPSSKTVTFTVGANPPALSVPEILAQIAAVATDVVPRVTGENGRLDLLEVTPGSGVTVDKTGTANILLGFSTSDDTVGTFYSYDPSAAPTAPCFVSFAHDAPSNALVLITWE